jgi:sarcosine oxidase subunit gamma
MTRRETRCVHKLLPASDPSVQSIVRDGFRAAQRTDLGLISLQVHGGHAQPGPAIGERIGRVPPPPCTHAATDGAQWLWSAPAEWLIAVAAGTEPEYRDFLEQRLAGLVFAANIATDSSMVLALTGERVREVLARGSTVDFDSRSFGAGACVVTRFAGLRALIACEQAADEMLLVADRSAADYLATWLEAASRDCHNFAQSCPG